MIILKSLIIKKNILSIIHFILTIAVVTISILIIIDSFSIRTYYTFLPHIIFGISWVSLSLLESYNGKLNKKYLGNIEKMPNLSIIKVLDRIFIIVIITLFLFLLLDFINSRLEVDFLLYLDNFFMMVVAICVIILMLIKLIINLIYRKIFIEYIYKLERTNIYDEDKK